MSYSFRQHGKNNQQSSSSSSGGHQRIAYGSRSTSTGTPPQTPTIRVTSPVPDVVGMIDIWDPEVVEDAEEPPPPPPPSSSASSSPKAYSFRYKEEKQHKHQRKHHASNTTTENNQINFADSAMQADPVELLMLNESSSAAPAAAAVSNPSSSPQEQPVAAGQRSVPIETTSIIYVNQIGDALSPIDDDGLKTAGESEESSDCEEISQISAVTQIPRGESGNDQPSPQVAVIDNDQPKLIVSSITASAAAAAPEEKTTNISNSQHQRIIWDEMQQSPASSETAAGKPVKRVQFSRSLSLVPGSSAAQQTASVEAGAADQRGVIIRSGAGRRYSSLDSANPTVSNDIFPSMLLTFIVGDHHQLVNNDRKMLSPTPESALENAQSPQQEQQSESSSSNLIAVATKMMDQQEELDELQSRATDTMTALSVTVEEVGGDVEGTKANHDPTCDLFDRLNALKNDEELMDLATGFVIQLLRSAQEETLRRGHVASKMEQKSKLSLELQHVAVPKGRHNRKWYSRLRMLLLRTLTCTCVPTHPSNIQSPLSN